MEYKNTESKKQDLTIRFSASYGAASCSNEKKLYNALPEGEAGMQR
ncbi:MAG: hypothetical protein HUJ51_03405 [Eggerthellaceae bacterium]|nr:hypothetical protein [Eggerthellaceae bacterium]